MTKISVVQMECVLGDTRANVARIERHVAAAASQGAEIVVIPEMATTGYFVLESLDALAEPIPGPTTSRLGAIAQAHGVYVACGMAERDGTRFYNSAVLVSPAGALIGRYRKVHLWADDTKHFARGQDLGIVDTPHGRIGLTICYDLMFPEYIRALVLNGARIILNATDWVTPEPRIDWLGWSGRVTSALASARAIETRAVVAMANRVGVEAGYTSLGYSCICSQRGAVLGLVEQGEGIATASVEVNLQWTIDRCAERAERLAQYRRWESQAGA